MSELIGMHPDVKLADRRCFFCLNLYYKNNYSFKVIKPFVTLSLKRAHI